MDFKLGIKRILLLSFVGVSFFAVSCDEDVLSSLGEGDTVSALKEALKIGAQTAASTLGKENGYFSDKVAKIEMPEEVAVAAKLMSSSKGKELLSAAGADNFQIDNIVLMMNRAAETAAPKAVDVFASAISKMSIADGEDILFDRYQSKGSSVKSGTSGFNVGSVAFGTNNSATAYLYDNTYSGLTSSFSPIIDGVIDQVSVSGLTLNDAWSGFTSGFNKVMEYKNSTAGKLLIAGWKGFNIISSNDDSEELCAMLDASESIPNTSLGGYVTGKALTGLFTKVADKEVDIRTNAAARTSDLLKRVFGRLDE